MEKKLNLDVQSEKRPVYEKPVIEVILMEMEAAICAGSAGDFAPGGGPQ